MFPEGRELGRAVPAASRPEPTTLLERERQIDEPVTGIVLAGGRGRRMGGRDKALLELSGRPLAEWVLDALEEVTDRQLIVARERGRLERFGVPVVEDRLEARGPLTGLHAGLKAASTDLSLVVATDMPLVRPDLLVLLARAVGSRHAAVPYVGEGGPPRPGEHATAREAGLQPLLAAYRRRCIQPLEKLLRKETVPTPAFIALIQAQLVPPERWREVDPDGRSFLNINTPADLTSAAQLLNRSA